jgi:hypothetical protein
MVGNVSGMQTPASPIAASSVASGSTTSIAPTVKVKGIRVFTNSKPHDFPTASDAYFDKEGNLSINFFKRLYHPFRRININPKKDPHIMLVAIRASLIGKSEVRHSQGGFVLTFKGRTQLGEQQIQTWIPTADGDKFPFGPKLDAEGVPVKEDPAAPGEHIHPVTEYSIIVTDIDIASEESGLALQTQIDELEQANSDLEDAVEAKDHEIKGLAEELQTASSDLTAKDEELAKAAKDLQEANSKPAPDTAPDTGANTANTNSASAAAAAAGSAPVGSDPVK